MLAPPPRQDVPWSLGSPAQSWSVNRIALPKSSMPLPRSRPVAQSLFSPHPFGSTKDHRHWLNRAPSSTLVSLRSTIATDVQSALQLRLGLRHQELSLGHLCPGKSSQTTFMEPHSLDYKSASRKG